MAADALPVLLCVFATFFASVTLQSSFQSEDTPSTFKRHGRSLVGSFKFGSPLSVAIEFELMVFASGGIQMYTEICADV